MRKTFVSAVAKLMAEHDNVVVLLGDIGVYGFKRLFEKYPGRIFNIGILEQATVSVAAGWALRGFFPIVHTISPFIVERAYEQLKIDFGYQKLPGIFVGVGGSHDYSKLGATHQCPADVAIMENIPGFTTYTPGNSPELELALQHAYVHHRAAYIRLSDQENLQTNALGYSVIKNEEGTPLVLSVGNCLNMTMVATMGLKVSHAYLNMIPGDIFQIPRLGSRPVIVVEPWYRSSISQQIADSAWPDPAQVTSFSLPKRFSGSYGSPVTLDQEMGFTAELLIQKIKQVCQTQP